MKTKLWIVILAITCVGLFIALIATQKQVEKQRNEYTDKIIVFSNELSSANKDLNDLRQRNLILTNDLAASQQELLTFSNQFVEVSGALAGTKASLQSAQEQIANLNGRITDLEAQNQALDQRAVVLTNTIAAMDAQIAETLHKLANSETNNAFLEQELQRQMAAKALLEGKFNDLNQVRAQVRKLHDELIVSRRLQWARSGLDPNKPLKGAQLLLRRLPSASSKPATPAHYDLNVEVGSDGSVLVIPPSTNTPAKTTH